MAEHYFLSSLLPELAIGHVPTLGFFELKGLLRINLSQKEWHTVETFLRLIDVENMRKIWNGEATDPRGNLTREELITAMQTFLWSDDEEMEEYIKDFLEKYHTDEERLQAFSFLLGTLLEDKSHEEGFLGAYYNFEREMRLVMLGFRAKKMQKKLERELQYEDPQDPLVAQILAQKDAKDYEPPFEYKELKPIFAEFSNNPKQLNLALTEYRFAMLREMSVKELFSLDRILGYMARLLLTEKWLELDVGEGIKMVDTIEGRVNG